MGHLRSDIARVQRGDGLLEQARAAVRALVRGYTPAVTGLCKAATRRGDGARVQQTVRAAMPRLRARGGVLGKALLA